MCGLVAVCVRVCVRESVSVSVCVSVCVYVRLTLALMMCELTRLLAHIRTPGGGERNIEECVKARDVCLEELLGEILVIEQLMQLIPHIEIVLARGAQIQVRRVADERLQANAHTGDS